MLQKAEAKCWPEIDIFIQYHGYENVILFNNEHKEKSAERQWEIVSAIRSRIVW